MVRKTYKVVIDLSDDYMVVAVDGVSKKAAYDAVEEQERYSGDPRPIRAHVYEDDGNGRGYQLYERVYFEGN